MIDLIALTTALTTTLQAIPELVALMPNGDPNRIIAYLDMNPGRNNSTDAVYQMKPGTIVVIWDGTKLNEDTSNAGKWLHNFLIHTRPGEGVSGLAITNLIVDGIPNPGDGQKWTNCGIIDGALPAEIKDTMRQSDREGIDFFTAVVEIKESGDA